MNKKKYAIELQKKSLIQKPEISISLMLKLHAQKKIAL